MNIYCLLLLTPLSFFCYCSLCFPHCHPLRGTASSVQVSLLASLSSMSPDTATESKFTCKLSWTVANPKPRSVSYRSRTTGSKAKQLNGAPLNGGRAGLALYWENTQLSTEVLIIYQLVIDCFWKPVDIIPIWHISFQEQNDHYGLGLGIRVEGNVDDWNFIQVPMNPKTVIPKPAHHVYEWSFLCRTSGLKFSIFKILIPDVVPKTKTYSTQPVKRWCVSSSSQC